MYIELFSNILQTVVVVLAFLLTMVQVRKCRKTECVLVACILASYALGIGYWLTYQLINAQTPQIFYVADLAWVATCLFWLCLEVHMTEKAVHAFRHWSLAVPLVVGVAITVYFCQWGDVLLNIFTVMPLAIASCIALANILYHRQNHLPCRYLPLHWLCLCYVFTEYGLWIASCFWISDMLTNPYFWFDFALTFQLGLLPFVVKKAVRT